jgi:hypothetical protein
MALLRWLCPFCGHSLKAPERLAGKVGRCPTCRNRVRVPSLGAEGTGTEAAGSSAAQEMLDDETTAFLRMVEEERRRVLERASNGARTPELQGRAARVSSPAPATPPASSLSPWQAGGTAAEGVGQQPASEPTRLGRPHLWLASLCALATALSAISGLLLYEWLLYLAETRDFMEQLAASASFMVWLIPGPLLILIGSVHGAFALWIAVDGKRRGGTWVPWALITLLLGFVSTAGYVACRPLLPGEVRQGGTGWNWCRGLAWLWTLCIVCCFADFMTWALWIWLRNLPASLTFWWVVPGVAAVCWALWIIPLGGLALLGYLLRIPVVVEVGEPAGPPGRTQAQGTMAKAPESPRP